MARLRVGVMISGRGSNMSSLIDAARAADFPAEIALVLSNRPDAAGLGIAREAGIATEIVEHRGMPSRRAFEDAVSARLAAAGIELICLAGFMRLLTPAFVNRWRDQLINIHPSLLPAFPGLETHQRAIKAGVRISGCTVHFVRADMDKGPIIAQAAVALRSDDTAESLAARVLEAEHRLYPMALRLVAAGAARVVGDRVMIDEDIDVPAPLFVPVAAN